LGDASLLAVLLDWVQPLWWGAWGKEENSMKALVRDKYGSPDVLELNDIDKPELGDDEVLVRVHAASVNPADWHLLRGKPPCSTLSATPLGCG
jgi:hypothetical protein